MSIELYQHPLLGDPDVVTARRAAAEFAKLFFEKRRATEFATTVSELARNAIVHGDNGTFRLIFDDAEERMRLRVVVSGEPANPLRRAETRSGYGVGLEFVGRVADELLADHDDQQSEVIAAFFLEGSRRDLYAAARRAVELSERMPASSALLEHRNRELAEHIELISRREEAARLLLGVVGHDIRNPLAVIQMSLDLARRRTDDERLLSMLERARRAVRRATHLASDITDFTAEELGTGWELETSVAELNELIKPLINDFETLYPERKWLLDGSGSAVCRVDSQRVVQALTNVLQNAAKYGRPKTPVTVRVDADASRNRARVTVSNESAPLTNESIESLFDPFTRDPSSSAKKSGIGLGLYTVRSLAEKHGGQVRASYHDGIFELSLELPLTQ